MDSNSEERGDNGLEFYLRTYENGRLILDYKLNGNQHNWVKITFPRSKVPIDSIKISQGVELDNISLHYMMKVSIHLPYYSLLQIPVNRHQ
jgi:hypothetical protein